MTDKTLKFDYGDEVRVSDDAPAKYHPEELGAICCYRTIETGDQAKASGFSIQTILYLVEFGNGTAIEIPQEFLKSPNA